MADSFVPGDVVQLKSGGPSMTVKGFTQGDHGPLMDCIYFSEGKYTEDTFPPEVLSKVD